MNNVVDLFTREVKQAKATKQDRMRAALTAMERALKELCEDEAFINSLYDGAVVGGLRSAASWFREHLERYDKEGKK